MLQLIYLWHLKFVVAFRTDNENCIAATGGKHMPRGIQEVATRYYGVNVGREVIVDNICGCLFSKSLSIKVILVESNL